VARLPARRRAPWFAAVAAALIVLLAGLSMWSQQRERQRRVAAERAKAELIYALQVTAEHLDTAKAILHRRTQGERRGI
jgi:ABC-type nickel/cobalt efflux system permease component RcnA